MNVSKSTVCRCVWLVCLALVEQTSKFITFPNAMTRLQVKRSFYAIGRIPNITGAVDGCPIKILRPKENTHEYICRKGWAAINIQVILVLIYKVLLKL